MTTISTSDSLAPSKRGARMIVLISVVLPPLALIAVMWLAWGRGFGKRTAEAWD